MNHITGLTHQEVINRRESGQGNNVSFQSSRSYAQILQENLFVFINFVFFAISVILISIGRFGDAALVVATIFGAVLVNVIQEIRAKYQLDKIALLTRPKATVIREGIEHNIDPSEIVLGDILVLRSGDQVVVDGQVVGPGRVDLDESLLTGESDLIPKQESDQLYSGSICVTGTVCYEATKVGKDSLAYQLTMGARAFRQVYTPLQQEINIVMRILILLACFLWFLQGINFLLYVRPLNDTIQRAAVIAGLVPAGLLLAITLAYALGALKIVGQDVLIQQSNAVESLSNINILCLDKTGTLTTNHIQLEELYPIELNEYELRDILAIYAASTTSSNRTSEAIAAITQADPKPIVAEVPFSSARKWSAIAFTEIKRSGFYILGAPEILAENITLEPEIKDYIHNQANQGLRVLLFAYTPDQEAINIEQPKLPPEITPLGILSFSDQLRPEAKETLSQFLKAGIELKIISGDNPKTVVALAKQLGLDTDIKAISGQELAQMDENQFVQAAINHTIFGRITPEQKSKLVRSLRKENYYVAMIGDGVNDVLSLKQANLGIAMESGSKATRSVADIVLLKDSFQALPYTFLEGQRIKNGILDVLKLFLIRVISFALLIISTGIVVGDAFPLLNKHSALVTLLSVGLPTFTIPIWAKPGSSQPRGMVRSILHFILPTTMTITIVALLVYLFYILAESIKVIEELNLQGGIAPGTNIIDDQFLIVPRSALVTILVFCGLTLVPFLKPPHPSWVGGEPLCGDWRYTFVALGLLILYLLIIIIPPTRNFFELAALNWQDYLILGLVAMLWALSLRHIWRAKLLDRFLGVDLS